MRPQADSLYVAGGSPGTRAPATTRQLLEGTPQPTAIVYANDLMAIASTSAATEAGLAIPDQLSVVGVDDIPLAAHVRPALTDRAPGCHRLAAPPLGALVEGEPLPAVTLAPVTLVERSSTSAPRAH